MRLKMIENMLDIYYNRGGFETALKFLIDTVDRGAVGFYEKLADFYYENGYQHRDRKKEDQYRILLEFAESLAGGSESGDIKDRTRQLLEADMGRSTNPEIVKRFLRKGWELTR